MNKEGIKKWWNYFIKVLSYLCLIVLFLIAIFLIIYILSSQVARSKGEYPYFNLYTIVSPSMEPNIKVYDVILVKRVKNESDLKIGDVITFHTNVYNTGGYTVTHRIYDIIKAEDGTKYITKGDNNQRPDDGEISFKDIVGKEQFKIAGLGRIQFFVSSKLGWLFVILIPAMGIILTDIIKLKRIIKIKKEIEEIPTMNNIRRIREVEENKRLLALLERSRKFNRKK